MIPTLDGFQGAQLGGNTVRPVGIPKSFIPAGVSSPRLPQRSHGCHAAGHSRPAGPWRPPGPEPGTLDRGESPALQSFAQPTEPRRFGVALRGFGCVPPLTVGEKKRQSSHLGTAPRKVGTSFPFDSRILIKNCPLAVPRYFFCLVFQLHLFSLFSGLLTSRHVLPLIRLCQLRQHEPPFRSTHSSPTTTTAPSPSGRLLRSNGRPRWTWSGRHGRS